MLTHSTMAARWFSSFLLKPFVSLVQRIEGEYPEMAKLDLSLEELDFSENSLTEKERMAIPVLLLRGTDGLSEAELLRQASVLEEMIVRTKCDVNALRLVFKGLLNVSVSPDGEITYRATEKGLEVASELKDRS
jgi:hypothetical protein